MSGTSCPVCGTALWPGTRSCPKCGQQSAGNTKTSRKWLALPLGCLGIAVLFAVIFACIATATKPTEAAMRTEVCSKMGIFACGAGKLGESLGMVQFTYHDYLFFSTLTVKVANEPEKTAAIGILGQIMTSTK